MIDQLSGIIAQNGGICMNQLNQYLNQMKTLSFQQLLFSFIDRSGKSDSDIYNYVGIDRRLFSKVRCNENYNLSKENVLRLCVSLRLNLEDTSKLLSSAGYSLSTNNDFDLVIRYCIDHNIYDIDEINGYLFDLTKTVLC